MAKKRAYVDANTFPLQAYRISSLQDIEDMPELAIQSGPN